MTSRSVPIATYYRWQRLGQQQLATFLARGERAELPPLMWTLASSGAVTGEADSLHYTPDEQRDAVRRWAKHFGVAVTSRTTADGNEELYAGWQTGTGADQIGGCFRATIWPEDEERPVRPAPDETAVFTPEGEHLPDSTPKGTRDVLLQQGRTPDPAEHGHARSVVYETAELARTVAAGHGGHSDVKQLAELCGELARLHDAEPQPRPCPGGCREDDDPAHDLVHRIGHRPRAVRAGDVRTAGINLAPERVRTLPAALPDDDATLVLVYRPDTPGLALLNAIRTGDDGAALDAVTHTLRHLDENGTHE